MVNFLGSEEVHGRKDDISGRNPEALTLLPSCRGGKPHCVGTSAGKTSRLVSTSGQKGVASEGFKVAVSDAENTLS